MRMCLLTLFRQILLFVLKFLPQNYTVHLWETNLRDISHQTHKKIDSYKITTPNRFSLIFLTDIFLTLHPLQIALNYGLGVKMEISYCMIQYAGVFVGCCFSLWLAGGLCIEFRLSSGTQWASMAEVLAWQWSARNAVKLSSAVRGLHYAQRLTRWRRSSMFHMARRLYSLWINVISVCVCVCVRK